jgi:hypothetical protein
VGIFTDDGEPGQGHVPLLESSPAINAGNDHRCALVDQLGQPRVNIRGVGTSLCDIGAIEFPGKGDHHHDEEEHHDEDRAAVAQAAQ